MAGVKALAVGELTTLTNYSIPNNLNTSSVNRACIENGDGFLHNYCRASRTLKFLRPSETMLLDSTNGFAL